MKLGRHLELSGYLGEGTEIHGTVRFRRLLRVDGILTGRVESYDAHRELEDRDLHTAMDQISSFDGEGALVSTTEATREDKAQREQRHVWMAAKLGLVQQGHLIESPNVTQAVLGRQLLGLVASDRESRDKYGEQQLFDSDEIYVATASRPS